MRLYSWNLNGIRAVDKKGELQKFLASESPDVACFQETKANHEQVKLDYPEYEKFWHSATRPGYSGTAIWSRIPPKSVWYGLPDALIVKYQLDKDEYGDPSSEGRIITLEFDKFYLINVYTPNSKSNLGRLKLREEKWDPAFLEYAKLCEETKPVILCGDFNVAHTELDLARPKQNIGKHGFTDEERSGFQKLLDAGFIDTFRMFESEGGHYTWWTHWAKSRERNVGWRIDYFLASSQLASSIKNASIHSEVMGSDHCPVSIELEA